MSRSSAKIRDHAEKTPSESADLTTTQREMILPASFCDYGICFSGSTLLAKRAAIGRGVLTP
jgi:hypothetical protein